MPLKEVPELSTIEPEFPAVPTFAVVNTTCPLPELALDPLTMLTVPPRAADPVEPPTRTTLPPAPLTVEPTSKLKDPPRPDVALPEVMSTAPVFPDADDPVLMVTVPDTPPVATFADVTTT